MVGINHNFKISHLEKSTVSHLEKSTVFGVGAALGGGHVTGGIIG